MNVNCIISGNTTQALIENLAKCLDVTYTQENNEFCIDLPEHLGSGYFRGVQFLHGVSVLEFDVLIKKALHISFKKETINPLRLLFNSDSSIRHKTDMIDISNPASSVSKLQRLIFSNGVSTTHSVRIDKNKSTNVFIISIDRKQFEEKIDTFSENISEELALIFKDVNGVNPILNQDYFPLDVSKTIEEFKSCDLDEFMKPIFLEGKTYEIITQQMQQFSNTLKGKNAKKILRKATISKVQKAVAIVQEELEVRINVNTLAKRVGLNPNTLQSGFKTIFKTSVNEFIKDKRLELGKTLLETSDLNITEITYKIGINSRSYFSKLFKEKYGIAPKDYLNQIRDDKSA
jgi:AraC-like DNA-binding protein